MFPRFSGGHALACAAALSFFSTPAWAAWPNNPAVNVPICTAAGDQVGVVSIPDGSGGAIIAWEDSRSGNKDVYVQRIAAAGDTLWAANGVALCTAVFDQQDLAIVSDGAGGAIVAWQDFRSGNYDVRVQRVNSAGEAQWTADGVLLCDQPFGQEQVAMVTDGAGGAIVFWRDHRSGSNYDIYARRVDAGGTPLWTDDGDGIATATDHQEAPQAIEDGSGGAIVTWHDRVTGNEDIRAQRVNAAGTPLWTANGVPLTSASNDQRYPRIVTDGSGGAIVAWVDLRDPLGDIFGQRVTAGGTLLWTPAAGGGAYIANNVCCVEILSDIAPDGSGGVFVAVGTQYVEAFYDAWVSHLNSAGTWVGSTSISTAPNHQVPQDVIPDGLGGFIVSFDDHRYFDIYAQRGAPGALWASGGAAISTANGEQYGAKLVADGSGGAFLAWRDKRNGLDFDIYAQRIERFGKLGSPEPTIVSVRDVPNDQGGRVSIRWNASYLDHVPSNPIDEYWIWRQVPAAAALQEIARGARLLNEEPSLRRESGARAAGAGRKLLRATGPSTATVYWEYLGSQVAHGFAGYSFTASTTADSVPGSNPLTLFMVEAEDLGTGHYWSSASASGYSVDNLPPGPPAPFAGVFSGGPVQLHWGASTEADFALYHLHRGGAENFAPDAGNLVTAQADTGHVDSGSTWAYYKLAAVDAHGNPSAYLLVSPAGSFAANTPTGSNVAVTVSPTVHITFQNVTGGGQTQLTTQTGGTAPPNGLRVAPASPRLYYVLTSTASFTGTLTVCVTYDPASVIGNENNLKLMHYDTALDPDAWVQVQTSRDPQANVICGVVSHLSEFALMEKDETVAVEEAPSAFQLVSCAPNPVTGAAQVQYDLPATSPVRLGLFDLQGRLVRELERHPAMSPGRHVVPWDGRGARGEALQAGVYFLWLEAGSTRQVRRVVVTR